MAHVATTGGANAAFIAFPWETAERVLALYRDKYPDCEQPGVAALLITRPHPLHVAHAHAGDFGRFDPSDPPRHRLQNHVL